jgi:hypothetical protein
MRHSKTEDIFIRMSSYYSLPIVCIAIPTNRSTPYSMLVAEQHNILPNIVVGFRGLLQKSHDLEDDFPLRTH